MIRELKEEDLQTVLMIEKEAFPDSPWTKDFFDYERNENPFSNLLVLEENKEILGYIDYWITYEVAQIANIAIRKDALRKGKAKELVTYCIQEAIEEGCETVTLEVRVTNQAAISLYEKLGFEKISIRKHYYENGEDAFYMVKAIGGMINDKDISD